MHATCPVYIIPFYLSALITFDKKKNKSNPAYISVLLSSFRFNSVKNSLLPVRHYLKIPHRSRVCNL
jgi:hypothetical protein